jgi:hypothetical protein
MFPGLSDIDAEFCINYILITRSMVELAGVFSKADKTSRRFAMLKKATCNVNNGQDVYFAGFDYRKNRDCPPEKLYIRTPHFSKESGEGIPMLTLGIFNVEEEHSKTVTVRASELGIDPCEEYVLTNVWSGERYTLLGELDFELVPHESKLIAISKNTGRQIYDANIELKEVKAYEDKITAKTCYKSDLAELTLSDTPKAILFNGVKVDFTTKDEKIVFALQGEGALEIIF